MPSASTVCKVLALPTAAAGAQMAAIGAGVMSADADQQQMVAFWSALAGMAIRTKLFFGFIGVGKLIGTAALWGYLPKVLRLGQLLPMLAATYMHAQNVPAGSSGVAYGAFIMACLVLYTMVADPADGAKKKKKT